MSKEDALLNLTIAEAAKLLKNGQISPHDLLDSHFKNIDIHNQKINAFVNITHDLARTQADVSYERIKNGEAKIIDGIPIGVKDLFCVKGIKTSACSKMLENFIPHYESTVTKNLYNNGGIHIGKTNMDEFAMGSTNEYSYAGSVISPIRDASAPDKDLVPGGSSGGSAAAVAGNMCLGALGSDTGGSIRQPAAFSGIVGFKPTYGLCSRNGMISFASSLDQAGVLTKSVQDAALLLYSIAGYDDMDPTSSVLARDNSRILSDNILANNPEGVKGMKIGIPKEYVVDGIDDEIMDAWKNAANYLEKLGAEIVDISLPNTRAAIAIYLIIAPAEMSSNLARYDGSRYGFRAPGNFATYSDMMLNTRSAGFGEEIKRRLLIGTFVLSAEEYSSYYDKAQRVRRIISEEFNDAFRTVDAILTPTAPTTAFPLGEGAKDPVKMYANDVFTTPSSMAGLPAASVPFGHCKRSKLPIGIQIIGNKFKEQNVFRVAHTLEAA